MGLWIVSDGSDEQQCIRIKKDPGYDVAQLPPLPEGNRTLHIFYQFIVFSIADVKTSDFYADVDVLMMFEWRDMRLELWNPPKKLDTIDCSKIFHLEFIAIDNYEKGHLVKLPEDRKRKCQVVVDNPDSLEKVYKDPYMGE